MKCLNPVYSSSRHAYVPCGQCYFCTNRKKYEFVVRCLLERVSYKHGYFITLTYDNEHLPSNKGVSYPDADYFLDNFRRHFHRNGFLFSYYLMSEYGGKSNRPHYHMHLFSDAPLIFVSSSLFSYWKNGFHKIGRTTLKSILYTSAFHLLPKEFRNNYPVSNFHIFSRGLGYGYFKDRLVSSYYKDNERVVFDYAGQSFHLPPYIIKKLGICNNRDLRSLNLHEVKNAFYLKKIEDGMHSGIWKQWEFFVNHLEEKQRKQGLKSNSF